MSKRNRIIVLVDLSKNTENLIDFAFKFSRLNNARVIFVHQVAGLVPALADEASRNEILNYEIQEARVRLMGLVKGKIREEDFTVSHKPLLSILMDLSNESYFDWVLTGLKETGSIKRLLIGSTTLKIVDETGLVTLAVPVYKKIAVPHKLLVGVTARFPLNKIQLENVLLGMKDHLRELEFFTVLKDDEEEDASREFLLALQEEFKTYGPHIEIYKDKESLELLKTRIEHTMDSFLVLQRGSRSLKDKLFRSFLINEIVYDAQTPLIVLSS